MTENVLDVLIYLFDNYMDEESDWEPNREDLILELEAAGFRDGEIEKALAWLDGLANHRDDLAKSSPRTERAIRIFAQPEIDRIDAESRGFIMYLCENGILTPSHREVVIERIMALDVEEIDSEHVKWVVLMVLFNMPGQEATYAWMEDLMFNGNVGLFH
ncbi:MAG: DUF494 domain-containing protein [Pseudomonadota bacterium]|nr:DUF494 domain-containing protein [Pseudomonadota bacterium]